MTNNILSVSTDAPRSRIGKKSAFEIAGAIGVCTLALLMAPSASATVVGTFTATPATVDAGQSVELDVQLNASADPGYADAYIFGGTLTINSGDGASQSINIAPYQQTVSVSFTYPDAGLFTPTVTGTVNYSEDYSTYTVLYDE